jgi:hypothetical protein
MTISLSVSSISTAGVSACQPVPVDAGKPASLASLIAAGDPDAPPRLFGPPRGESLHETLRAYTNQPYRPLRRSEFHSSGFLTEGQKLPYGKVHGTVTPPQIRATPINSNALPYTLVSVSAPKGATYQVGDSLLSVVIGREVRDYGEVIQPTVGRCRSLQHGVHQRLTAHEWWSCKCVRSSRT